MLKSPCVRDFSRMGGRRDGGLNFGRATRSATSAVPTPASEAEADAERRMVEVERKMDALFAQMDRAERHQDSRRMVEVERKMDALFAEMDRAERHQDSTSPGQDKPPSSPPLAVAASPAPPPATSPVMPHASEAAADADRPVAAVERESDAMAAEVRRLERHQEFDLP